jgi:transcriptional regulator with XRE-family HTH domain
LIPDASKHDPRPEYLRALIAASGLSQRQVAKRIGVSERMVRYYLAEESADHRPAPYPVQFAIEALANRQRNTRSLLRDSR